MKKAQTTHGPDKFFFGWVPKSEREDGMVFIWDDRPDHESGYAWPTRLASKISHEYPMGVKLGTIRVIPWSNGVILTIICNKSENGFSSDIWAGLTNGSN